jgi:hypothetical protein
MFLILILLFFIILFPYLMLPFIIFFLLMLLFIPFKFTLDSFFNILFVPKQLYKIAINAVLRRNHALEHATINILERDYYYNNLAGYAEDNGFYIIGADNLYYVEEAARKGLDLLKSGYSELAIHKRCGTSLTVANFISAISFLILLLVSGYFSIINVIISIIIANLLSPYFGGLVQKYFTTSLDIREIEIDSLYFVDNIWNRPIKIFVKTTYIPYIK